MSLRSSIAFTLIELLVVITIIVVLLALLTPALDKAIYSAELAACASNLKSIATGSQLYAASFKRHYPDRLWPNANNQPNLLANPNGDDRPKFEGFVDLKLMVDPLAGKVRLSKADNPPVTNGPSVFSSVSLWPGARFSDNGGVSHKGMFKLGDRFTFNDTLSDSSRPTTQTFSVLACDRETVYDKAPDLQNTHPDDKGIMSNTVLQSGTWAAEVAEAGQQTGVDATATITFAVWRARTTLQRGAVDLNFAFDDGSVSRYHLPTVTDERMARVPVWTANQNYSDNWFMPLPPLDR